MSRHPFRAIKTKVHVLEGKPRLSVNGESIHLPVVEGTTSNSITFSASTREGVMLCAHTSRIRSETRFFKE